MARGSGWRIYHLQPLKVSQENYIFLLLVGSFPNLICSWSWPLSCTSVSQSWTENFKTEMLPKINLCICYILELWHNGPAPSVPHPHAPPGGPRLVLGGQAGWSGQGAEGTLVFCSLCTLYRQTRPTKPKLINPIQKTPAFCLNFFGILVWC